jgi:hypothetical protein
MTDLLTAVITLIPQAALAIALFYMCQMSADKQREAYQEQLRQIYTLAEKMIETVNEVIEAMNK